MTRAMTRTTTVSATTTPDGLPCVVPAWDAPAGVRALATLRIGGVSRGPWGSGERDRGGLNLGARCGDDPDAVAANRMRVARAVGSMPAWLEQVHGIDVHRIAGNPSSPGPRDPAAEPVGRPAEAGATARAEPRADASVTSVPGVVLAILTADCLPVLLADTRGRAVAAAHAGWRGLAHGILERTVEALRDSDDVGDVVAWLGPAIGPAAYEVGADVRDAFCDRLAACAPAFVETRRPGKWLADLHALARVRLAASGVDRIHGAKHCTFGDPQHFYSYRRDGICGRMAALVWLDPR